MGGGGMGAMWLLVLAGGVAFAVAPDPNCPAMIKAAKEKDDAAELVLENANKAFNATVKAADAAVAKAVANKEAANTALDTAQDADNAANIQMQTKSNEFNNAVLRLQDVITLCSQPQPPSDCHTLLQGAQDNVKATNTTYEAATNAFNSAEAELKAKQTALEDAEHEYTSAIGQKDDSIRGAEEAIQKAVEAKSKTADDYATVVRNCAPHVAQGGRQSYHL